MNGSEARSIQVVDAYRTAGKPVDLIDPRDLRALQRPGGFFRIIAEALAGDEAYRRIAAL
jgi:hypothetical protein